MGLEFGPRQHLLTVVHIGADHQQLVQQSETCKATSENITFYD